MLRAVACQITETDYLQHEHLKNSETYYLATFTRIFSKTRKIIDTGTWLKAFRTH